MNKFWSLFFTGAATLAVAFFALGPKFGWWFPGPAASPLGTQIDDLFYLILVITAVTFIAVHAVLGYILWKFSGTSGKRAQFQHGSHALEVVWSIVPAGILLFIALYQMDVWAAYRMKSRFDPEAMANPIAEVSARQFEWRIRYPKPGTDLMTSPQPGDLYYVNEVHVPAAVPTMINLRTQDVQHAFFVPRLRVKQDAVPGLVIPVWFEIEEAGDYELLCAELCGWGHYKMKARIVAESPEGVSAYLTRLEREQNEDGVQEAETASVE